MNTVHCHCCTSVIMAPGSDFIIIIINKVLIKVTLNIKLLQGHFTQSVAETL